MPAAFVTAVFGLFRDQDRRLAVVVAAISGALLLMGVLGLWELLEPC